MAKCYEVVATTYLVVVATKYFFSLQCHQRDSVRIGAIMSDFFPQENRDWLLDSAIGRWLGIQRLAVTNLTVLKVLLWLVLLGLFSELDFGLPFFLLSLFYWLYEGLRSPVARRPGEMSAYSVFNPNCQPILGTLTAEQLEGEMGYRPLNRRVNT